MTTQPLPTLPRSVPAGHGLRVEYLAFKDVLEHREYHFRLYGLDGSSEVAMRIAIAAFDARRVRMQDGPDVCYQMLLRAIAAGELPRPQLTTIQDADLFSYRDDHIQVAKRRKRTPPPPDADGPHVVATEPRPRPPYRPRAPRPAPPRVSVAPVVTVAAEPALEEGQRVNHAVFGAGVTTVTTSTRTVVRFDVDGPRTFVSSMVKLDVLSAPHTWETTARGTNRPCKTPASE